VLGRRKCKFFAEDYFSESKSPQGNNPAALCRVIDGDFIP
jgi:hypothetical protein